MIPGCFILFYVVLFFSEVSSFTTKCTEVYNFLNEGEENHLSKRQVDCPSILQDEVPTGRPTVRSDEDRKKLQARLFEGLLHIGTVVNHIDTFIMDKGKMILKSLGKMAASDEDTRFQI